MHITKRVYDWSDSELKYCRQLGVRHIIAILPEELNQAPWEFLDLLELRTVSYTHLTLPTKA